MSTQRGKDVVSEDLRGPATDTKEDLLQEEERLAEEKDVDEFEDDDEDFERTSGKEQDLDDDDDFEEEDDFDEDDFDDDASDLSSLSPRQKRSLLYGTSSSTARHHVSTREIMTKFASERERVKEKIRKEKLKQTSTLRKGQVRRRRRWRKKMDKSPYTINLVAESQRIQEETRTRQRQEIQRRRRLERRKQKVKNDIILKALAEESDLLSLREEKRAIQREEMKLKALLDLEKTKLRRKQDLLAAQRAERKRHEAKNEHRRQQYVREMTDIRNEEMHILKEKYGMA